MKRTCSLMLACLMAMACDKTPAPAPPPATPPPQKAQPQAPAPQAQFPNFADLVEQARPAVINIYTKKRHKARRVHPLVPFAPKDRISESLGSGFIISQDGLALTNHHVIEGATSIEVRLLDERRFKARVVGEDPKTDVALLQLEDAKGLPVLELGDSEKLRVGEWVIAIGNPLGLTSTVTAGIASAIGRRNVPLSGPMRYKDFIQTDTSINPGNSGGPLLDVRGKVVGINTAINAEGQGIGFAIPANMVKQILDQLKTKGRVQRSWLGLYVGEIGPKLRKQLGVERGGALITGVVRGGPAEAAKLRPGDVVTHLDAETIDDASHLSLIAGHKEVGKVVDLKIRRGRQQVDLKLKLGALPD